MNYFLAEKYGNGAFVDHYNNRQFYLDKNTLEEKHLDYDQVAKEGRDFLVKMSGVADAYTLSDLMDPSAMRIEPLRRALDPKTAGDIILEFNPGWNVVDDSKYPQETQPVKSTGYQSPAFISGEGIPAKVVNETVEAVAIAPTIAQTLRIRAPNSAKGKPLNL